LSIFLPIGEGKEEAQENNENNECNENNAADADDARIITENRADAGAGKTLKNTIDTLKITTNTPETTISYTRISKNQQFHTLKNQQMIQILKIMNWG